MTDATRVGDDYFKFIWTFEMVHIPIAGVKGSCMMVHSSIERQLGFDVGLKRSVGEDWATMFMYTQGGYPCKWVYCQVQEQSPFTLTDFIKQRNRWHKSLLLNTLYSKG